MVSSGTGQQPAKPSEGVLFLLQRSGLMANSQYVERLGTISADHIGNAM
jgi:hypothetical protein